MLLDLWVKFPGGWKLWSALPSVGLDEVFTRKSNSSPTRIIQVFDGSVQFSTCDQHVCMCLWTVSGFDTVPVGFGASKWLEHRWGEWYVTLGVPVLFYSVSQSWNTCSPVKFWVVTNSSIICNNKAIYIEVEGYDKKKWSPQKNSNLPLLLFKHIAWPNEGVVNSDAVAWIIHLHTNCFLNSFFSRLKERIELVLHAWRAQCSPVHVSFKVPKMFFFRWSDRLVFIPEKYKRLIYKRRIL